MEAAKRNLWTVILAAGEGTRLRPLTRALHGEDLPKQYAQIQPGATLLQATASRAARWSAPEHTVVVVAREREGLAREQLRGYGAVDIAAQPGNFGTGPGILLPLARILARDPEADVVILPSDHYVAQAEPFADSVAEAVRSARGRETIVLVGAVPERPETQYGWIVPQAAEEDGAAPVARFHEKPAHSQAVVLMRDGGLWNTFIMAGPAANFDELGRRHLPVQAHEFDGYRRAVGQAHEERALDRTYERLPPGDWSRDVLERAGNLHVVPLQPCGWSDWGTPERVVASLRGSGEHEALADRLHALTARRDAACGPCGHVAVAG